MAARKSASGTDAKSNGRARKLSPRSRKAAPGADEPVLRKKRSAPRAKPGAAPDAASIGEPAGSDAAVKSATPGWLNSLIERARERGRIKADVLRARFANPRGPMKSERELGQELVRSAAMRAGLIGAATGTLSLITLPVGLPAGIATTLFLEAELLFALLALYRIDDSGEVGRMRLAALWAGAGFADAAKSAGLKMTANLFGRALAGTLPARLIARLEPALMRAILKRLGLGFIPRLFKLWPLLGAPFAFAIDRAALRALGRSALDALEENRVRRARTVAR